MQRSLKQALAVLIAAPVLVYAGATLSPLKTYVSSATIAANTTAVDTVAVFNRFANRTDSSGGWYVPDEIVFVFSCSSAAAAADSQMSAVIRAFIWNDLGGDVTETVNFADASTDSIIIKPPPTGTWSSEIRRVAVVADSYHVSVTNPMVGSAGRWALRGYERNEGR